MEELVQQMQNLQVPEDRPEDEILQKITLFGLDEILTRNVPEWDLRSCSHQRLSDESDRKQVPTSAGIYFIVTDEPIGHSFHPHLDKTPRSFQMGNKTFHIVYNGTADNLRARAEKHLLRKVSKGMSGISVDILRSGETVESHTKCLWDKTGKRKIPYCISTRQKLKTYSEIQSLITNEEEKNYLQEERELVFFKNGIDVQDPKHRSYEWHFYWMEIRNHSVRDLFETTWRRLHGCPILCSYSTGR